MTESGSGGILLDDADSSEAWLLASEEQENNGGTSHNLDQLDFLGNNQLRRSRRRRKHFCFQENLRIVFFLFGASLMAAVSLVLLVVFGILFQNSRTGCGEDTKRSPSTSRLANLSTECPSFPWKELRLPKSLVPTFYDLLIHPNLTSFTFLGIVQIDLNVSEKTDLIILNSKDLEIKSFNATVLSESGKPQISLTNHRHCALLEQSSWKMERTLEPGSRIRFWLSFDGNITNRFAGLYRSAFREPDGKISYAAVTQFESTDARSMFPCFDEPAMKAEFKVSLVRNKRHVALANMPQVSSAQYGNPADDLFLDKFNTTVKMSSYLLAIAVGNFVNISDKTKTNTKVSVFTPAEQIQDANFALDVAIRGLEFLESFFNITFPLPKQDLLAVSDFSSGAMENWGLVTFRDQILLWNQSRSSTSAKELTATVIIHELAHQWFGNLVTMAWWNDLWLNEGFAAFVEYFGTGKVLPEWKLMERFYSENIIMALYLDGMSVSHPVSSEVSDPADIGSIFDAISYQKGASVINMIMDIGGEENFQRGLHEYLSEHKYGNAEGEDLWNVLNKHISTGDGLSLPGIAKSWTTRVGYPMVTVKLSEDRRKMILSQERFMYLEKARAEINESSIWPIPVTYRTDSNSTFRRLWLKTASKGQIDLSGSAKWVKLNTNGHGFYRVLYPSDVYETIIQDLKKNPAVLAGGDRGSLIYDAFSFVKAGLLPVETVLNMLEYIVGGKETEYIPLTIVFGQLRGVEAIIWETEFLPKFKEFVRSLFRPAYERFGWKVPEDHSQKLIQSEVLSAACKFDIPECVEKAKELFDKWLVDENHALPPDLRSLITQMGVKFGNVSVWDAVYERYTRSVLPSEQALYLGALAETRNPWLLNRFLLMILDTHKVKPNLMNRVLGAIARNPVGRLMAWRFMKQKWPQILHRVGLTTMLGNAIKVVVQDFSTEFDYNEVKSFFMDKDLGKNKRKFAECLETIEIHIQWRRLNEQKLKEWLDTSQSLHRN